MRNPVLMSKSTVPLEHSPLLGADSEDVLRDDLNLEAMPSRNCATRECARVIASGAPAPAAT